MRTRARWAMFAIVTAVLGVATILWLLPRNLALTPSELTLGSPAPPSQPTQEILSCTSGSAVTFSGGTGEWSLRRDHPPCTFVGYSPPPVTATAAELLKLKRRPRLLFQVAANGDVRNATILQTSGSRTFDEKSLTQIRARRYQQHHCGVCTISTVVSAEFQGPVWIPESAK
jgi:hypothetical protein